TAAKIEFQRAAYEILRSDFSASPRSPHPHGWRLRLSFAQTTPRFICGGFVLTLPAGARIFLCKAPHQHAQKLRRLKRCGRTALPWRAVLGRTLHLPQSRAHSHESPLLGSRWFCDLV